MKTVKKHIYRPDDPNTSHPSPICGQVNTRGGKYVREDQPTPFEVTCKRCIRMQDEWTDVHGLPGRFASKVNFEAAGGCWEWKGTRSTNGYGGYLLHGRMLRAHRFAYETLAGAIPAGMVLDHVCFVRHCVNPMHLRLVTRKQNNEHLRSAQSNNLSCGVRGVTWDKRYSRWKVQVGHGGGRVYGGMFVSLADAETRAIELRAELFTHDDYKGSKQ